MTDISSLQRDLFCTPLDVRLLNEQIQPTTENSKILLDDNRVLFHIYLATSEVSASLYGTYGGDSALKTTPFAFPPIVPKDNPESGITENSGDGLLYGIQVSSSAKTELWTITFSDATTYSVKGSRSGSQGSGNTGSDFTSTNGWITIPSDVWSGTPASGDKFYVSVWDVYPVIGYVTSLLAASLVHDSLFTSLAPNESPLGSKLKEMAYRILDNLNRGYDENGTPYRLPSFDYTDLSEMPIPFWIDYWGRDVSNYSDVEEPAIIADDIKLNEKPWYY